MLILASKSPRREEILHNAGYNFKTIPSNEKEIIQNNVSPNEAAMLIAKAKAKNVSEKITVKDNSDIIIGADTIVVLDNEIMGKPKNKTDAFRMLDSLSGRVHTVITGVCVLSGADCNCFYETTEVEFYPLSENEINSYIATDEPFDKAGAYGIQEKGALFVKRINGDFFNVMGLPIARLSRIIRSFNYVQFD